jgi:hypothetical protein
LTLHRPYINQWAKLGSKSYELQPGVDRRLENYDLKHKTIDFLFYGQYFDRMFDQRNRLVDELLEYSLSSKLNIKIHLQLSNLKKPFVNLRFLRRLEHLSAHSKFVITNALPPLYGQSLYEAIGKSKFVINAYTDYNQDFKSNMRLFESLGCGSLLISEEGNYPNGFEGNKNFIPYKNSKDLIINIPKFVENYSSLKENMLPYINEVKKIYSKKNQWEQFKQIVNANR